MQKYLLDLKNGSKPESAAEDLSGAPGRDALGFQPTRQVGVAEAFVEFFVTPNKLEKHFELQWNPLGGVFDVIIKNQLGPDGVSKKFTGDWSYTAKGMQSAVRVDGTVGNSADVDRSWTVEVTLPFSDLGLTAPKPGTVWRGNFYRFSRGTNNPERQLAWSPARLPGYHQPSRFGYLEFGR